MRKSLPILILLIVGSFINNVFAQAGTSASGTLPADSAKKKIEIQHAIEFTSGVMKNNPDPKALPGLHYLRAMAYLSLKEYEKAIKDFSSAIALDPKLKDAYINRGLSFERSKNYQSAIDDYTKAKSFTKDNTIQTAALYNDIARMQRSMKNYDAALATDSTAIAVEPRYTPSNVNRGEMYAMKGMYQLAIKDFTIALNGNYPKPLLSIIVSERADAKRHLKQYRDAINDYSLAIELNPDNRKAYWNRAASYNNNGDYALADEDYTKAISYYKGDNWNLSRLYDDRAVMEIGLHQLKKAIEDDSLAITLNNKLVEAHWNKANAHAQNADFQLSIDDYIETANFYQGNKAALAQLFNNIANEEYFLNDYQKVIEYSNSAIALDSLSFDTYLNRGRAYLKKMNTDIAMADFKKVLVLDTSKKTFDYAFALFYTGKHDAALQVMQSNIVSTTNEYSLNTHYYNLACLFSLMNRPDEANTYLKKCIDGGYPKKYALNDPDLENIRSTQEFKDNTR